MKKIENQIDEINTIMRQIVDNSDRKKQLPNEYYILLKKRQKLEKALTKEPREKSGIRNNEKFINSFGEATTRYITCDSYERNIKQTEKSILRNMGF